MREIRFYLHGYWKTTLTTPIIVSKIYRLSVKMPDTDTLLRHDLFGRILRKKERLDAHRPLPESAVRKLRSD